MKKIVDSKGGFTGSVIAILFLLSLCGLTIWWGVARERSLHPVMLSACAVWLFGCYLCLDDIFNPTRAFLAIADDRLIWSVKKKKSSTADEKSIALGTLDSIEIVLPRFADEVNSRDYSRAELHLIDINGSRFYLPRALLTSVTHRKIIAALKVERPNLKVVERFANT